MQPLIGIIGGHGRMGQLFAKFFRERGIKVLISDIKTPQTPAKLAAKVDICIVSVPIDKTLGIIEEVLPHMKKDSAIMDFTSVKQPAVRAMLKGDCEVLGVHPMFGNSNPIPGQTVILCPTKQSGKWAKWLKSFLLKNKVKIREMSAQEHDKIMNLAQGLIHFADITFADSLRRCKMPIQDLLSFTGKASELKVQLAARLVDQDPNLYANIQIENPNSLKSLKEFRKSVDELIKIVEKKDVEAFIKYFLESRKFMGDYCKKAYKESSHLIDELIKLQKGSVSKKVDQPSAKSLAVLGPKNTYTDLAAQKHLQETSEKLEIYYASTIDEVFELVASRKVKEGVVPIENKLQGTVRETLDNLFEKNVHIAKSISIPINHALITIDTAKKSDIKIISSHNQALNQCKKFLKKNFPLIQQIQSSSTMAAIEALLESRDLNTAVIASEIAAKHPGLKILSKGVGDSKENETTFVLIKKGSAIELKNSSNPQKRALRLKPKQTSIAFHFSADSPGSLFSVFKDFANAKINLTKIESRPTKAKFGDYIFYLNFEGSLAEPKIKKIVQKIEKKVAKLKVLGSY